METKLEKARRELPQLPAISSALARAVFGSMTGCVVAPAGTVVPDGVSQAVDDGVLVHAATTTGGFGLRGLDDLEPVGDTVSVAASDGGYTLQNGLVRYAIGADGTIHEAFDKVAGRSLLADRAGKAESVIGGSAATSGAKFLGFE